MDPVHIGAYRNAVEVFHLAAENGAFKPGVDGGNYQLFIEKLSENFNHSISHDGGLFEFPSGIFAVGGGCGAERLAEVYEPLAKLVTLVILIASYREAELGAVTLSAQDAEVERGLDKAFYLTAHLDNTRREGRKQPGKGGRALIIKALGGLVAFFDRNTDTVVNARIFYFKLRKEAVGTGDERSYIVGTDTADGFAGYRVIHRAADYRSDIV